jgi:hypothetical protein
VAIGLWWGEHAVRGRAMRRAGGLFDLRPRARLAEKEWDELAALPLIGLARRGRVSASAWVLEGAVAERTVRVFDLGFQVTSGEDFTPKSSRAVQTVAVVSVPGLGLHFHCSTRHWWHLGPEWPAEQGLTSQCQLLGPDGEVRALLRTPPGIMASNALPGPLLAAELMRKDVDVECCPGLLMVYGHEQIVRPRELGAFLETVKNVVGGLSPQSIPPSI